MIDHTEAAQSIAESLAKIGAPLSPAQLSWFTGVMWIWLKKEHDDGIKDGLDEIIGVMRELREGME